MNGGYIMIYKDSRRIYLELFVCLTLGKPILWYEDKDTCFFIDTISGGEITTEIVDDEEVRTYGDIILTKGGMTITITAENVVSEVGDIQPSIDSVTANPTLSGDEDDLTGLEVNGVKYAISSGGEYAHHITLNFNDPVKNIVCVLKTMDSTPFTPSTLWDYMKNKLSLLGTEFISQFSSVTNYYGEIYLKCCTASSSQNQFIVMSTKISDGTTTSTTATITLTDTVVQL